MSGQSWWELSVSIVALLVMAAAATVDATANVVSRHQLRQMADQRDRLRTVQSLLDPARSLHTSLLVVQAITIAVAASLLTTVALREFGTAEHLIAILAVTIVFLILGQIVPRALASVQPERAIGLLLALAGFFTLLVRPITYITERVVDWLAHAWPGHPAIVPPDDYEEQFRSLTREGGGEDDIIEAEERQMIDAVLRLEETRARDIMVPRVDIVAVEASDATRAILAKIIEAGHSRLPVYRESIDRIIGILYAKDLLPYVIGDAVQPNLIELLRPAHIVPESKRIDDLLTELRRNRIHIAIVVDEYGGTAGLVTIEDILEEIVGEIQDEYDVELPLFEQLSERELLADGRLPLDEVAEAFGIQFVGEGDGTVAGFVHRHLGRLPVEGDHFAADGLQIEVVAVEGHRVRQLRFRREDGDEAPPGPMPLVANEPVATEPIPDDQAPPRA
ncbi:MAG: hemolysin family protein [Chloroflexota bacterium]|nr:hemolysin family protein [Chloroflexota bacterium]